MVELNGIFAESKGNFERREVKEAELKQAGYTAEAYLDYVRYERTGKKAATADPAVARNLFERAVADHPRDWAIWEAYLTTFRERLKASDEETDLNELVGGWQQVAEKATRFLPDQADSWISLMRLHERQGNSADVEATFEKAWGTGLFNKNVEDVVKLYMAKADFHRRLFEDLRRSYHQLAARCPDCA